ncbi:hypothetical protein IKF04_02845 [Candidatus Saccharibacteria bacterium]|nr:hypothetical protein [Candidatus Saccharibacteria bacterium]
MQNQQTQQGLQNDMQPFFTTGQGTNSPNVQFEPENNLNTSNWQQRRNEIPSQIGGAAIGGAAIDGAATGASQAESPIPGAQEPLGTQTLPNAIGDSIQEGISNPEVGSVNTEAANIIPFPPRESQSSKDEQTQTDELPRMTLDNRGDSLSEENQKFVKKLIEDASKDPFGFYREATEARKRYSESIRRGAA